MSNVVQIVCVVTNQGSGNPNCLNSRFASVRCEEVAKAHTDRVPEKTNKQTKKNTAKCLRIFQEYTQEKGIACDLSPATAESLSALLEKFNEP